MNCENFISLPGFAIGALAAAASTNFDDTAMGLATVLGGIAGLMMNIGIPSQRGFAENPFATVDNNTAPRANEV